MARIVQGLATSHSPQVSTGPEEWHLHAERDRTNPHLDFPALVASAPQIVAEQLTREIYQRKHDACQAAIDRLGEALRDGGADVVVVIGDDQRELFLDECNPAFAIFTGAELVDIPPPVASLPPSIVPSAWARHGSAVESYPTMPDLATHIASSLSRQDFDVATVAKQFDGRSIGHAYTFVRLRLMQQRVLPIVPIFVNCYFPPNQPSPSRCFAFGQALRRAIEEFPGDAKVAIVASGGLTHFIIDEAIDRQVLRGIAERRPDLLRSLPADRLNSGSSEIRNWIAAAGALEGLTPHVLDYVPAYRSPAGTGCGMAFMRWDEAA